MLQKTKLPIIALGMLFTLPAWADDAVAPSPLTANVSIVNDYVYRGISRTNGFAAVQGGVDLAASNGFYIGIWGSNVSWLADQGAVKASSLEVDGYVGVKNSFFTDFTYDFGVMRYHYPAVYNAAAVIADTDEIHGAIGYQWLSAKYSYSMGNAFGIGNSKGTHYMDISANYPIPDSGITLAAHYGTQTYQGVTANNMKAAGMDPSYSDAKLGLSYNMNGYVLGAAYSKTFKMSNYYVNSMGNNLGRAGWIFSLNHTF
jgi:uncharacterized protein (TIGR02001 family)